MRTVTRICVVVVAISAALPFVAGARGGAAGRGGGNSNVPKDGCGGPNGRSGVATGRTTKHSHQPFAEYDGEIVTPPSQKYQAKQGWYVLIDFCKKEPKLAYVGGAIPGYYCGSAEVFTRDASADLYDFRREVAIPDNHFNASITARVYKYTMSGSLSGSIHIPKRGHGSGNGTIAGTVTPSECRSVSFKYSVKFRRTWTYFGRGGAQ
jgi:hypothetical protein